MDSEKIKVTWDEIKAPQNSEGAKITVSEFDIPQNSSDPAVPCNGKVVYGSSKSRNGYLLPIIAAVVIGIITLGVFFATSNARYKQPIESVLQQDKLIPQSVKSDSAVVTVSATVQRMRGIDLSECPEDFRVAYQKHTEAWAKAVPVLRQAEELNGFGNFLKSFIIGLIGGYTGQFHLVAGNILENAYASDELKQEAQKVDAEIKSTYSHVLQLAQKYKVDIRPYSN